MKYRFASALCLAVLLAAGAYAQSAVPKATVLGNSIDLPYTSDIVDALTAGGINVTTISAAEFPQHQSDSLIIILGGQNTPEGVGGISGSILEQSEKNELISGPNARAVRVVTNKWAANQTVIVFAGYNKEQTRKAFSDAQDDIIRIVTGNSNVFPGNYTDAAGQPGAQPTDLTQLKVC